MANKKISDLTAVVSPALADLHEVEQGGSSKKETTQQILSLAVVKTTGRVDQGIAGFGVNHAASNSGLFICILDVDGTAGPASINLLINGVLQYQIATNVGSVNMVACYFVNAGDIIRIDNAADPAGVNQFEDNFILPLIASG